MLHSTCVQNVPSIYFEKEKASAHRCKRFFVGKYNLCDEMFDQNVYLKCSCSTRLRKAFYYKHLFFVTVKESSVNPINWAGKDHLRPDELLYSFLEGVCVLEIYLGIPAFVWASEKSARRPVLFWEKKWEQLWPALVHVNYIEA